MLLVSTQPVKLQLAASGVRFFAAQKKSRLATRKFYQTLGVTEDCDDEILRLAFVNLAKRFHPDSGTNEASPNRFSEIENAYRQIQRDRFEEREKSAKGIDPDVEEFDIEHTAPQHRHYLAHDVGVGTPGTRQRRFQAQRAQKAAENVMEHRLKKLQADERNSLVGMDKRKAKDVKTRYGMDRLVEDLIQEAMNKGEFNDLRGMGKPLQENSNRQNPYVDFVTHKLNQVLIDNGFTPEWIQLSKEIREDTEELRKELIKARNRLGELPLTDKEEYEWNNALKNSAESLKRINSKIDKYNLLVPILQKQMLQINIKSLAETVLATPPDKTASQTSNNNANVSNASNDNFVQLLFSIFGKQ